MDDPFDLKRFVDAQDGTFETALAELRSGRKRSHWIWFVFPQLSGLGTSALSRRYAISGLEEARAYLAHPVLGPRLTGAVSAALRSGERDPHALFGSPDDMKVRSCLTLFALADPSADIFREAIGALYDGALDPATCNLVGCPFGKVA